MTRLFVELPAGIPTYSAAHFFWQWPQGKPETVHLYNDFDIWWIRSGQAGLHYRTGRKIVARSDDFLLMPPYLPFWASEHKAPLTFHLCHFTFRPVPMNIRDRVRPDFQAPGGHCLVPTHFSRREAPEVARAYRDLVAIDASGRGKPWQLEQTLLRMVSELAAFGASLRPAPRRVHTVSEIAETDRRVPEIKKRIELNPEYPWKVATLAREHHLSTGRLHFLFRQSLGTSLKAFIVEQRLKRALELLNNFTGGTLPSIKEVSNACGYSSQNFFCRQFKDRFHVSPSDYVQQNVAL
jgi:AraC-like DNA-binding protein